MPAMNVKESKNKFIFELAAPGFTKKDFELQKNDAIYMFSDGYADQFGGKYNKKFMIWKFKKILEENSSLPMEKQKEILLAKHAKWKKDNEQVDDILVMGLRFNMEQL